jgi:hypothetical protein
MSIIFFRWQMTSKVVIMDHHHHKLMAQNGSVTAPGSQGVFRGKGVDSYMGARQLFGSLDTLSSCRDKRSSFLSVGKEMKI